MQIQKLSNEVEEQKKLVWLKEGDSLRSTIDARLEESGYEHHLKIVHRVQKDLGMFSDAILNEMNKKKLPRGEPRIFLFIDDLDRCPPKKAAEVLEAIQLLVKTGLFVVILMVDLRFLILCLEQHPDCKNMLKENKSPSGIHFIGKFIQLPYRLPPIRDVKKMDNFLRSQIKIKEDELKVEEKVESKMKNIFRRKRKVIDEVESKEKKTNESVNESKTTNESEPEINDNQSQSTNTDINQSQQISTFKPASEEKSIDLDNEELKVLTNVCSAAMLTPRCIKRITNCYKILKYIWFERNQMDQPNVKICRACLALLCLSASTTVEIQNDLKKSFCWLERGIREKQETFWKFLKKNIFVNSRREDWPNTCLEIAEKYFDIDWKEFEDDFWLTRSFTFVGDFIEDENDTNL